MAFLDVFPLKPVEKRRGPSLSFPGRFNKERGIAADAGADRAEA
jgi:hypothetical protein